MLLLAAGAPVAVGGCVTVRHAEPAAVRDIAIAGVEVFPESVTSDAAGHVYVGSSNGTIYRAASGARAGGDVAQPWVLPDAANGLRSLFGVLVDDAGGVLWTCDNGNFMSREPGLPPTRLKAFSLKTASMVASHDFPSGPAACNDIAVDAGGNVWATETVAGRIFVLRKGGAGLELFAAGQDLVGIDGIAIAGDGTIYINNVRQNLVQRINRRADGSYAGLTTLALSQPVNGPDGLRPLGGNRFLQAEGPGGRIALLEIHGDSATVTPVKTGLDSSPAITRVGRVGYAPEGKIQYRMDPALRGKDPGPFVIRAFVLPEAVVSAQATK
ncbi:MAG: hypothetical protein RLZZ08_299 [Pseudomonadota bacterium]